MARGYDQICNACGKDIHPPHNHSILGDDEERQQAYWQWYAEEMGKQQDCIWIERYPIRGAAVHPMTNYICTDCAATLDAWLRRAGAL